MAHVEREPFDRRVGIRFKTATRTGRARAGSVWETENGEWK